jgi:hypothetical protein
MRHWFALVLCLSLALLLISGQACGYDVLAVSGGMFIQGGVRYTHRCVLPHDWTENFTVVEEECFSIILGSF